MIHYVKGKSAFCLMLTALLLGCGDGENNVRDAESDGATVAAPAGRQYNWDEDFGAGPFTGAIKGTKETSGVEDLAGGRRIGYDDFIVVTRSNTEGPGEYITFKAPDQAEFQELPFIEAGYFAGIWKGYLLVDEGTGPDHRILKVVDPHTREVVYTTLYNGALIDEGALIVARPVDEAGVDPKPDCAGLEPGVDLPVGYMRVVRVTPADLTEEVTGQVLCYYMQ